jgi:hypothetical protein
LISKKRWTTQLKKTILEGQCDVLGRRDPIIGTYFNASVVLIEDYDIGDEGAGFPSVDDRHSIHPHEDVDQLKIQMGSTCKTLLEMSPQFLASNQDPVSFVPSTNHGGSAEADHGSILLHNGIKVACIPRRDPVLSMNASELLVHDGLLCFDELLGSVKRPARSGVAGRTAQLGQTLPV